MSVSGGGIGGGNKRHGVVKVERGRKVDGLGLGLVTREVGVQLDRWCIEMGGVSSSPGRPWVSFDFVNMAGV